jgi:polyhydroxyalkanoate synthesis regulator phasin
MIDEVRTLLLAGVGAIDLGDEKVRQIAGELVRRGELVAGEARALADAYAARRQARRERDVALVRALIAEELARLNVASQADVVAIADRVGALEQSVQAPGAERVIGQ